MNWIAGIYRKLSEWAEPPLTASDYIARRIDDLGSKDRHIRHNAVRKLVGIGPKAVEPLVNVWKKKSDNTRKIITEILGEIDDLRAVKALISEGLRDKNENIRSKAIEVLRKTDKQQLLIDSLKDEDKYVRLAAEPLVNAWKKKSDNTPEIIAEILEEIEDLRAVKTLIFEGLRDRNENIRLKATEALRKTDKQILKQLFIDSLKDEDEYVRLKAVELLGSLDTQEAADALISALKDSDGNVRMKAVQALGKIRYKKAVPYLINALKDDFLHFRTIATAPYEIPLAVVRSSAVEALENIGASYSVQHIITALKDEYMNVRESAAKALGNMGDLNSVEPLITALADDYVFVRRNAAEALGKLGHPDAIQPLINLLKDEYDFVRSRAAAAIDDIMLSNKPFQIKSHSHMLCSKCFLRAEKKKLRIGLQKEYTFVACRGCGNWLYLIKNISQAAGLIGGDIEDCRTIDEKVYISLWSEAQKKARNADIDILEIRHAKSISYDYAVNAVLITLKNDASRPGEYVKQVPVVIHGNPPIPEGVMTILRHEFGEIRNQ